VSHARPPCLARRARLAAVRRAGRRMTLGAVPMASVNLKMAQSNNGMHPTANSVASMRETWP
jgi:hypothetical protein